jgi:hypothetical protein
MASCTAAALEIYKQEAVEHRRQAVWWWEEARAVGKEMRRVIAPARELVAVGCRLRQKRANAKAE